MGTDKDFINALIHSEDFLAHYGKLGMKWGKRSGSAKSKTAARTEKKQNKEAIKKAKILKSPTKLYRHRDKFSQEEIDSAMKTMKWERELRGLSKDQISSGAQFAQSVLAYGTAASAAYGLYKSPAGQAIKLAIKK